LGCLDVLFPVSAKNWAEPKGSGLEIQMARRGAPVPSAVQTLESQSGQLLETDLGTLLLFLGGVDENLITPTLEVDGKRAGELPDRINRKTLGQLIRSTQRLTDALGPIESLLADALDERSRLAHTFYRPHNFRRNSDGGRAIMLKDLESMHEVMLAAYKAVNLLQGIDLDALVEQMKRQEGRAREMQNAVTIRSSTCQSSPRACCHPHPPERTPTDADAHAHARARPHAYISPAARRSHLTISLVSSPGECSRVPVLREPRGHRAATNPVRREARWSGSLDWTACTRPSSIRCSRCRRSTRRRPSSDRVVRVELSNVRLLVCFLWPDVEHHDARLVARQVLSQIPRVGVQPQVDKHRRSHFRCVFAARSLGTARSSFH
jgi:hypothetical protein